MPTSADLNALLLKRDQLKSQLAQIGEMRPGSLVARFRKCGKPSCHCSKADSRGHGPCYSLTRPVAGKTLTRVIPAGPAVEQTQRQLEEYQRFRQLIQQLVSVSEQICDCQLRQAKSEPAPLKKNSTRRPSRR